MRIYRRRLSHPYKEERVRVKKGRRRIYILECDNRTVHNIRIDSSSSPRIITLVYDVVVDSIVVKLLRKLLMYNLPSTARQKKNETRHYNSSVISSSFEDAVEPSSLEILSIPFFLNQRGMSEIGQMVKRASPSVSISPLQQVADDLHLQ